jgi:GNAT superfamily N-acetyltransferase
MATIRFAREDDTPTILGFIRALAAYERLEHECIADEAGLRAQLFGPRPHAEVLLVEEDAAAHGFALFFHNFSTFLAKPGLYLEDLFVDPAQRGKGYGKALLIRLAEIALARGCGRLEWSVLDWNQPSIDFYRALGARPMQEWTIFRLEGDSLSALAAPGAQRDLIESDRAL